MGNTEGKTKWENIISEWKESGITRAEFCRRKDLRVTTFDYWRKKLHKALKENESGFIRIPLSLGKSPGILRIYPGERPYIEIEGTIEESQLRQTLSLLREQR